MTYDQVLTLDYIVTYGSFKAASEAMHKSQPSLSMAIKKLEEEHNIQIFDRSEYRPKLTDAGKTFYLKAKEVIKSFQQLEHCASHLAMGLESEITICVDSIFPIQSISDILFQFFEPHINTILNLNADVLEGVIQKVKNHEVDFAFGPQIGNDENIEAIKFVQTQIVPVVGEKHAHKAKGNLEYLKSIPQIVVSSSVKEERENIQNKISDQIWYTSDFSMREQLIEAGLGWGRLPIHQIDDKLKNKKLFIIEDIPQVPSASVPMYLLRSKNKVMGPNTTRLWNYLVEQECTND